MCFPVLFSEGKAFKVVLGVFFLLHCPRDGLVEHRAFIFELVPEGEVGFGQGRLTLVVAWRFVLVVGNGLAVGEGSDGRGRGILHEYVWIGLGCKYGILGCTGLSCRE